MNLIAKEYLAARTDGLGVLIISETAGAASELSEAIIVNPNDDVMIADSINEALSLSNKEKKARHAIMQKRIKRYDVTFWAETFIERLKSIEHTQPLIVKEAKNLNNDKTVNNFTKASKRLFILDYDGTLSPIRSLPHQAKPKKALKTLLTTLCEQDNTDVVIISGRDKETLESWLGDLPIALASDHGVWIKRKNKAWSNTLPNDQHWLESVSHVIQKFSDEMPGSFIEEKTHSIAFHYRNSEPDMVSVKLPELKEALRSIIGRQPIEMQDGRRVLEVKDQRMNKGQAALSFSSEETYDFIFIAGDDTTDEDMFKTHPNHYTVKIGYGNTSAKYRLKDPDALHDLLQTFIKAT
jgi:trehalose 6-phosphate synthase/phosphatase